MTFDQGWFNLARVDLHAPAEHTFDGIRYPMEVQLVHKRYDSDAMVNIAVPIKFAAAASSATAGTGASAAGDTTVAGDAATALLGVLSAQTDMRKTTFDRQLDVAQVLDFNPLVGDETEFFSYPGSSTQPPCMENVTWFVRKQPLSVVAREKSSILTEALLQDTGGVGNYRSTIARGPDQRLTLARALAGEPVMPAAGGALIPGVARVAPFAGETVGKSAQQLADGAVNAAHAVGWGVLNAATVVGNGGAAVARRQEGGKLFYGEAGSAAPVGSAGSAAPAGSAGGN